MPCGASPARGAAGSRCRRSPSRPASCFTPLRCRGPGLSALGKHSPAVITEPPSWRLIHQSIINELPAVLTPRHSWWQGMGLPGWGSIPATGLGGIPAAGPFRSTAPGMGGRRGLSEPPCMCGGPGFVVPRPQLSTAAAPLCSVPAPEQLLGVSPRGGSLAPAQPSTSLRASANCTGGERWKGASTGHAPAVTCTGR